MDLVDEYLRVVATLLPKGQREDIIAELRDTLLTRKEAKETELGRPLTPPETEAMLRDMGHPLVVAGWYSDGPQHVVGPALYPYWMFAVKVAITIQVMIGVVVLFARTIGGDEVGRALGEAVGYGLSGIVTLVGLATIAAWVIERFKVRIAYFEQWRVRDLHMLEFGVWDLDALRSRMEQRRARRAEGPMARARYVVRGARYSPLHQAIGVIVGGTVLVLWWLGVLNFGIATPTDLKALGVDYGSLEGVDWAGLRQMLFWPVLAYGAAVIVQGIVILAFPRASWLRGLMNLAMGGTLLAFCSWFWTASPIAGAVRVDSLAGLIVQVKTAFAYGPPIPLGPVLSIILACVAFGAICRIVRGLYEILAPAPADEDIRGGPPA